MKKLLHIVARMLVHELVNMNINKRVWTYERMGKTESFLKYYVYVDKILEEYSLTHKKKYLLTWKNILPHVHGWMIFMDEKMDYFILNVGTKRYFCKLLNKINKVETIYVGVFQKQFDTWNTQITFQSHISYFFDMKYIQVLQHPNHIEC